MKKYISTLIITLLAVGLGIYVLKFDKTPENKYGTEKNILNLSKESISTITIIQSEMEDIVIKKSNTGDWTVSSYTADINLVNGLLEELSPFRALRGITLDTGKLEDFGLKEPKSRIKVKSGDEEYTVLIGDNNIDETAYFVMLSNIQELYTIQSHKIDKFLKDKYSFRNRQILEFDSDKIEYIKLVDSQYEIEARKTYDDEDWQLIKPINDRANNGTITTIINSLKNLQAIGFVTDKLVDLTEYGIDSNTPSKYAVIKLKNEKSRIKVLFGKNNDETGNIYAKNEIGYSIYEVSPAINDSFAKSDIDLRFSYPLDFETDEISKIEISAKGMKIKCRRKNEVDWEMTFPLAIDCSDIIPRLLSEIRYSTINKYTDTGIAPGLPAIIQLSFNDDRPLLKLTVEDKQEDGTTYVKSSQRDFFMNIEGYIVDVLDEIIDLAKDNINQEDEMMIPVTE